MATDFGASFGLEADFSVLDKYADRIDDLSAKISAQHVYDIETDVAAKNIAKLGGSFDDLEGRIKGTMSSQKSALAAMILAGQEGSAEYEALASELRETKAQADKLSEAAKQVEKDFFGVAEAIEEAAPEESFFKRAFAIDAVEKAGGFLDGIAEQGKDVAQEMVNLSAKTGLVGAELDDLKDRSRDAFVAGIGENLAEAIQIMGQAQKKLGDVLDPQNLQDFVTGAGALQTVFGNEVPELIDQSRSFIKSFGLEGKEAYNLIALGMRDATTADEDFLDSLKEYSPLAKEAGFAAEEFVGTLVKGGELGAFNTDKIADAIKETQIRLKAGDISTAISEFKTQVPEALFQTIAGATKLAETGQISIKELLNRTSGALEGAFDSGEISDTMRSKLEVAISGTPAEELGTSLYGKIFGAPIDVEEISSRAAEAGAGIQAALGPVSFFEKSMRELDAIKQEASAVVAPYIQGIGGATSMFAELAPGLSLLDDKFKLFEKASGFASSLGGNLLSKVIPALSATGSTGVASFFGIELSAASAWAVATGGLVIVGAALAYFLTQTESGRAILDDIGDGFNTAFTYATSFFNNSGELISAFADYAKAKMNPASWFGEDTDAEAAAKEKLSKVITKAIDGAKDDLAKGDMAEAIVAASDIQVKIKAVAQTDELVKNFEEASAKVQQIQDKINAAKGAGNTAEVEKLSKELSTAENKAANFADRLAKDVPSAVTGVKTVVDANGKLKTTYDINIEKVKGFNAQQKKTYDSELIAKQKAYNDGLKAQANELKNNQDQLDALGEKIAKGGATPELLKQYDELKKKIGESGDKLKSSFKEGQRLGIATAESTKTIATAFQLSEDAANKLFEVQKKQSEQAKQTALDIGAMAKSFASVKAAAEGDLTTQVDAYAEALRIKALSQKDYEDRLSKIIDQAEKDRFEKARNATKAELEQIRKDGVAKQREVARITQAASNAQQLTDPNEGLNREIETRRTALETKLEDDRRAAAKTAANARDLELKLLKIQQDFDAQSLKLDIEQLSKKTGITVNERNTLRTLQTKQNNLDKAQRDEYTKKLREFEQEDFEKLLEQRKTNSDQSLEALQLDLENFSKQIASQAISEDTVKKIGEKQNAILKQEGEAAIRDFIESTDQFTKGKTGILELIGTGKINKEEAAQKIEELVKDLATKFESEPSSAVGQVYKNKLTTIANNILEAQKQNTRELEELQIKSLKTAAERERATVLLEAERTYKEKVRLAAGNAQLEHLARMEYLEQSLAAEEQYQVATSRVLQAGLLVKESLIAAFNESIDPERQAEIEREKEALLKEEQDLQESLDKREIVYEDYVAKTTEILKRKQELESEGFSFFNQLQSGLSKGLSESAKEFSATAEKTQKDYLILLNSGEKDEEKLNAAREKMYEDVATAGLTQLASFALSSEATLSSFSKAAGMMVLDSLQSMIPSFVAGIFGQSFATLGPILGPLATAGLTATLYGLVNAAKAAIGRKDGEVDIEGPGTTTSDDIPRLVSRRESIITAKGTMAEGKHASNREIFEWVNRTGRPIEEYFMQNVWGEMPGMYIDGFGKLKEGKASPIVLKTSRPDEKLSEVLRNDISVRHLENIIREIEVTVNDEGSRAVEKAVNESTRVLKEVSSTLQNQIHHDLVKLQKDFYHRQEILLKGKFKLSGSDAELMVRNQKRKKLRG